ncbi:MAG: hypothetical protein KDM63_00090 [Verrucomicrobiae bacterium]|nr:hypothetical protein [Verrucomicrobiae bacterium]MCB1090090.1 hypothetical protein [Verrucomicrobiae bacterium]
MRPPLPPISSLLPNAEPKIPYDTQEKPDGMARIFDLTFFSNELLQYLHTFLAHQLLGEEAQVPEGNVAIED